ncbi:helix-turn-helix domain-containing protein [Kitasatospora sp. McL0602]|uniref:helix-turn-helix domain-containing protein n=1 Tax=Kitasatospora sp. McL0602 TaxID=3439530 RepID=UPI003F888B15
MPEKPRPVTQDDYDQIRELHAQGLGRNEIMRETGRSANVVSRLAAEMGLSFARAGQIAEATEIRRQDLAARRLLLAEQLQADAEQLRQQLWQPAVVYAFGGKDNTFESEELPEPPAADKRALMSTVGIAIDRSLKLEPVRDDSGADAARSMIGQLMTGLGEVYRQQQAEAADAEGAGDAP